MKLNWQASAMVSCLHAAEAWLRTPARIDPALARALATPVGALQAMLQEEGVVPDSFWSQVVPLAAGILSLHELTIVTLTKVMGRAQALPRAARICGLLGDVKNAFLGAVSHPDTETVSARAALPQRWSYRGQKLLSRVVAWTDPGILVDEATIIMVFPVLGGGGSAHLPYNSVHIETVPVDPHVGLPEVLRLAWLLSALNLDLPRYCENLRPNRLTQIAGLAMVPVILTAATELGLECPISKRLGQAIEEWVGSPEKAEAWADILRVWWESYRTVRPAWATALQALDRLLP